MRHAVYFTPTGFAFFSPLPPVDTGGYIHFIPSGLTLIFRQFHINSEGMKYE
jgi:hypothetical protein